MQFHNEHFTAKRMQITTSGVSASTLNELVAQVNLDPVEGPVPLKPTYYGGEYRVPNYVEPNAYVAIAGECPGWVESWIARKVFLMFGDSNIKLTKMFIRIYQLH